MQFYNALTFHTHTDNIVITASSLQFTVLNELKLKLQKVN